MTDFGESVKRVPAARAGYICSNPECRALTSGPQDNPTKAVNVGVAVHIMAASAGGPRYDVTLSPEQRSAPSNGCQNCAKLIDNDRFSLELLTRWRADAETEARSRVGKSTVFSISDLMMDVSVIAEKRRLRLANSGPARC